MTTFWVSSSDASSRSFRATRLGGLLTILAVLGAAGCAPASTETGTGGAKASGGTTGSGGASSGSGGNTGSGGSASTGGSGTGGSSSSGGSSGQSGGSTGSGGATSGTGGTASGGSGSGTGGSGGAGGAGSGGRGGNTAGSGGAVSSSGGAGGGTACSGANKAVSFNGTDGVVTASLASDTPLGNTARTVELWVYAKSTTWKGEVNTLFEYGSRAAARGVFGIDFDAYSGSSKGGNVQMYVGDGAYDYFFDAGLGTATYVGWFHLASIYDPTTRVWRATVNGVEKGMRTLTTAQTLQTQMDAVSIGRSRYYPDATTSANPAYFDGYVDEVRIWNTARTPQQILDNMHKKLPANEAGLVAQWNFDEGSGTTTMDSSGKGHNGTFQGGVTWIDNPTVTFTCP